MERIVALDVVILGGGSVSVFETFLLISFCKISRFNLWKPSCIADHAVIDPPAWPISRLYCWLK
jgi:hypothetical protein